MSQTLSEKEMTQASRRLMQEVNALQGKPLTYMQARQMYARVCGFENDQSMISALQNPPPVNTVSLSSKTMQLPSSLTQQTTANPDEAMISFGTPSFGPGTNLLSAASNDLLYRWIRNEVRNAKRGLIVMLYLEPGMAQASGWKDIQTIKTTTIDTLLQDDDHNPENHTLLLTLDSDLKTGWNLLEHLSTQLTQHRKNFPVWVGPRLTHMVNLPSTPESAALLKLGHQHWIDLTFSLVAASPEDVPELIRNSPVLTRCQNFRHIQPTHTSA